MNDEQFEQLLREAAEQYRRPPETPRSAMWASIQESRQPQHGRRRRSPRWALRQRPVVWVRWGAGIAAVLMLGIGIGRVWQRGVPAEPVAVLAGEGGVGAGAAYQWVAAQHFARVETCLTEFHVEARAGRPAQPTASFARELLTTTRLLMDSPVADEAQVRALLEDIELVLAQIAQFPHRQASDEVELIEQTIERRSVLLRLRSAVPVQPTPTLAQGVL